jgi:hypothetical protein
VLTKLVWENMKTRRSARCPAACCHLRGQPSLSCAGLSPCTCGRCPWGTARPSSCSWPTTVGSGRPAPLLLHSCSRLAPLLLCLTTADLARGKRHLVPTWLLCSRLLCAGLRLHFSGAPGSQPGNRAASFLAPGRRLRGRSRRCLFRLFAQRWPPLWPGTPCTCAHRANRVGAASAAATFARSPPPTRPGTASPLHNRRLRGWSLGLLLGAPRQTADCPSRLWPSPSPLCWRKRDPANIIMR